MKKVAHDFFEDDGLDYEDLYYDDSTEVDYGLEYTTT